MSRWRTARFRLACPFATYVSLVELCLLGLIAGLPRANPVLRLIVEAPARSLVVRCARTLADVGVILGYGSFARLAGIAKVAVYLSFMVKPATHPVLGVVQAREFGFVRSRGTASLAISSGSACRDHAQPDVQARPADTRSKQCKPGSELKLNESACKEVIRRLCDPAVLVAQCQ